MPRPATRVFLGAVGALLLLLAMPSGAQAPAPQPMPPASGVSQSPTFKPEELEQLAAPIALYPDALVAQILMASTYPLEVVEAARWAKANPNVKDKALEDAMQQQTWDPSVKSLTAFPQVLAMMNDKLDWTQKLGDAFLAQQKDLMGAVQRLRAKAYAAGNLKSGKEQTIKVEQQEGATVYIIEPADPQVVYVPTYNPTVVYGPWPYPAYPPYYYYPPGYVAGPVFVFSVGIIIGSALWGGCHWGGGGNVYINHRTYNNFNRTNIRDDNWEHKPEHRKGAQYRDTATQQRFGGGARPGVDSREAFRGRPEQGRQEIAGGGNRGGPAGNRGGSPGAVGGREPGAFEGVGRGGETRDFSNRGASSRASAGASRPSGGGGVRPGGGGGMRAGGGMRGGGGRGR
jgi:uncharacterized membrane protein YgcG